MSFGFLPNEGQPDFEAMMRQFKEMGLDPAAIEGAMQGAKTFFDSAQSLSANSTQTLIAREFFPYIFVRFAEQISCQSKNLS
jgi:hypothetical protein